MKKKQSLATTGLIRAHPEKIQKNKNKNQAPR